MSFIINPYVYTTTINFTLTSVIIDDEDPEWSIVTGTWPLYTGNTALSGYKTNFHSAAPFPGIDPAYAQCKWSFTDLIAGDYRVAVTWNDRNVNRASNAPLSCVTATQTLSTTVNMLSSPGYDYVFEHPSTPNTTGEPFEVLFAGATVTDGTLDVYLGNDADDYVIADAVYVERNNPLISPLYIPGNPTTYDWVLIGEPGNTDDAATVDGAFGGVGNTYYISKFTVREADIYRYNRDPLNATRQIAIDSRDVNKPATNISWNEAARFVNWLNIREGHPPAYKYTTSGVNDNIALWVSSDDGYDPNNEYRNSNAYYFLPSEDEWYKAAYYDKDAFTWSQVGSSISGTGNGDRTGNKVALNDVGDIVVATAPYNSGGGLDAGEVRVFQNSGGTWSQLGNDIEGSVGEGVVSLPVSVSINGPGDMIVTGWPGNDDGGNNSGQVRVYKNVTNTWTLTGGVIDYSVPNVRLGAYEGVDINTAGNIVATGAWLGGDTGNVSDPGEVRVYEMNAGGTAWVQLGQTLSGETTGVTTDYNQEADYLGFSVALNSAGNILAAGMPWNDNNNYPDDSAAGAIRVWEYIGNTWVQIGNDIDGGDGVGLFGYSVDINNTGNIVAGTGPSGGGPVRVYENISGTWTQIGDDIIDAEEIDGNNNSVRSVRLNGDGDIVVIGRQWHTNAGGSIAGRVEVYKNIGGTWTLHGTSIDGSADDERFGDAVSINDTGDIIAAGAPDYSDVTPGEVRIFEGPAQTGGYYDYTLGSNNYPVAALSGTTTGTVVVSGVSVQPSEPAIVEHSGGLSPYGTMGQGGNVQEWVESAEDKTNDSASENRVARGGSYLQPGSFTNVSSRGFGAPNLSGSDIGFRVARKRSTPTFDGLAARSGSGTGYITDPITRSMAMNKDTSTVVVGDSQDDTTTTNAGKVGVYDWNGSTWVRRGDFITGTGSDFRLGSSVDIDGAGNTIIIGEEWYDGTGGSQEGRVFVYEWDGSAWIQKGTPFTGGSANELLGTNTAISFNGDIIAMTRAGVVEFFEWNGSSWTTKGSISIGSTSSAAFNLKFSPDGNIATVTNEVDSTNGFQTGLAAVYEWNGSSWVQKGSDFLGTGSGDRYSAVAVNENATRFVGAYSSGAGDRGFIEIYNWNGTSWSLIQEMSGSSTDDQFGNTGAMARDGSWLLLTAIGVSEPDAGELYIYKYDADTTTYVLSETVDYATNSMDNVWGRDAAVVNYDETIFYLQYNDEHPLFDLTIS